MPIVNPFNFMPRGNDFVTSAVRKITTTNFDINAKVQVFESGGGLPRESIFIFDYIKNEFFPLTIGVNWGTTDRIKIIIEIKYNIKIPYHVKDFGDLGGEASGTILGLQEWVIQYPEQGLLISKTNNNGSGVKKSDGDIGVQIACDASESPQGFKGPFIAINTNISISKSSSGITVNAGINNATKNGSISTEIISASSSSRSTNYEFKVNLSVIGRPNVVVAPRPLEVPEDLLTHNVYFEIENQKDLSAEELRRLEDKWHDPLFRQSPKLYNAIKSGKCQIWLSGYASTTGKEAHNKNLSKDRITSVEEALKTDLFKSKNVKFVRLPQGEKSSTQKGAVARERRVEIQIQKSEAIIAMM
ncbi:MAG TPA: hypothetical protein PKY50_17930 [Candidatus Competibacter sp.]|nr:hypothetical protein [Candidatus Competibacter sp.]